GNPLPKKTKLDKSVKQRVRKGMQVISDKLSTIQSSIATNYQHVTDLRLAFKDMIFLLEVVEVFKKANTEGEKWEKNNPDIEETEVQTPELAQGETQSGDAIMADIQGEQPPLQEVANKEQTPLAFDLANNEEKPMVLHESENKNSEEIILVEKESVDKPPINYSPSPSKEPTPPRDVSKRKGVATKEPLKEIIPFLEKGGSEPKMPNLKSFAIPEGQLTAEDIMAQGKEIKRLAELKAKKEKSKESMRKMLNPPTVRAQTQMMAEHEAKRAKMLKEYNDCIYKRADKLPIMKISYRVSFSQEASMRITRGNDLLNIMVYEKFRLKTLSFNEWLEIKALES
ncbi:hypothetical protein Tco_1197657, partial [Tanacetum coccineum]